MKSDKIICAYHGNFNYDVVNGLLKTAKINLSHPENNRTSAKKTYNILVECLENIHKHSEHGEENTNEAIFLLTQPIDGFSIAIGNLIPIEEKEKLVKNIDELNDMTRDELKAHYRTIIENGQISDRGGAGLGMTDIALKSRSKLNYTFNDYSENELFFSLSVHVKNK
tara:strand:- start:2609 stop:3112 length:504 start_codon:yes stop_codon:yes gene_type:complete